MVSSQIFGVSFCHTLSLFLQAIRIYDFLRVTKNDKLMHHQISVKVPIDVFESLQQEAAKHKVSISDIVRERIMAPENNSLLLPNPNSPKTESVPPIKSFSEIDLSIIEVLFLIRESFLERNGQVLKKIDEKMEKRFGKDRKKIL